MNLLDTIVALSTPPGRGGLGVVRISGPDARRISESILQPPIAWESWRAHYTQLLDREGRVVDDVVATFFAAPRSYTAEDVVEISCHGSPVILRHAVERAMECGGRLAEPGEFTLRAYANGRIDLPQAEAVHDLIEATTLYQARIAAQQVNGSISRRIAPIKEQLVELIALLEAGIDFAEDDVAVEPAEEVIRRLVPVLDAAGALASSFKYGGFVQAGLTLAIVGRPNVGKSSLFNRLLQADRAIVTDIPGTTRDVVSETASIGGIPVKLHDTAGIRESPGLVETLGIERSYQAMADSDLTLVLLDATVPPHPDDRRLMGRAASQGRHLIVANKCDLLRDKGKYVPEGCLPVSALTGEGVDRLREAILRAIAPGAALEQETGFITNLRHAQELRESEEALGKALVAAKSATPHEMLLLDLYAALRCMDAVTGATTADDILNRIFSKFCIGK